MSFTPLQTILLLVGAAVLLGVLLAGIIYAGSSRRTRRYRPGRPFSFIPVWFIAAPERQILTGTGDRKALVAASTEMVRAGRGDTGGASDRW